MAITILGEHITVIRPTIARVPQVPVAGSKTRATRPKTVKLTWQQKLEIARQMGFQLATEGCMQEGR